MSIDFPEKVQERLYGWLPDRSGLRCTKQEHLHLTILFLGECDENETTFIVNKLKTVRFDPFQLVIQGVGAFPNKKNPRVIWAGVNKINELMNLQKQVSDELSAFADGRGDHPFKPHITLARTTRRFNPKKPEQLFKKTEPLSVVVESISLKKSILSAEGSIHTVLERVKAE